MPVKLPTVSLGQVAIVAISVVFMVGALLVVFQGKEAFDGRYDQRPAVQALQTVTTELKADKEERVRRLEAATLARRRGASSTAGAGAGEDHDHRVPLAAEAGEPGR